ncbi:hypothetical protein [Myxococcus sp. RHSTA-1-4]|uniref:hypothetical protein n=1 Tax=Myxococcus sp. RHSTA-1-4 TaxID=2874601 RepID=UPI001CC15264|nr:hypothetical protein [Myxococcus sp. RHSTA-1-4]MBZ4422954.1 hypothetical protein [Myxococcus sp. RHSTA-1-4]
MTRQFRPPWRGLASMVLLGALAGCGPADQETTTVSSTPSGEGCVARPLVIDYDDFDTNPDWDTLAPNMTTEGVLRHELGHILGFRHEHTHPASGTCFEDSDWRALTPYDPSSVMHYQWCSGVMTADMRLTDLDERGSVSLYGLTIPTMSAALF